MVRILDVCCPNCGYRVPASFQPRPRTRHQVVCPENGSVLRINLDVMLWRIVTKEEADAPGMSITTVLREQH